MWNNHVSSVSEYSPVNFFFTCVTSLTCRLCFTLCSAKIYEAVIETVVPIMLPIEQDSVQLKIGNLSLDVQCMPTRLFC
jgi:hypothetical protein